MKLKIIKTEEQYTEALTRVEVLMDAKPGSAKEEELELWSLLVAKYEDEHFPIDLPVPLKLSNSARSKRDCSRRI